MQDWCNLISAVSEQKLKQALMSQHSQSGVLRVNFDPALVRLLREVRYFLLLPDLPIEIPANALKVRVNLAEQVASSKYSVQQLAMNDIMQQMHGHASLCNCQLLPLVPAVKICNKQQSWLYELCMTDNERRDLL